jgi:transcriptional regulator of PTS gene
MDLKKQSTSLSPRRFQRAMHRSNILRLIRTTGLISRTDLARETGLSQASVTGVTADLIQEGLIEEKQAGAYEGGRRPTLLAIRPDGVHVVGVNMAIDQIRIVIVNFQAELKAAHTIFLDNDYYSPEEIVELMAQAIQACIWEANFSKDQIAGVGVGIPGPVDSKRGVVKFLPNYGWEEISLKEMLQQRINHSVFIDNSSNNLAIAEYWYGSGKGMDNFIVVTLENGVGAGMVVNGQLVRGNSGIASEFGHMCAEVGGPACRCGRNGCIEAFAGNYAFLRDARNLIGNGSWYSSDKSPGEVAFDDVLIELNHGNEALENVYRKAGMILGVGIYNLMTLLNPELVIIRGKGVQAGGALFSHMFDSIEQLKGAKFGFDQTEIVIKDWTDEDWARESGSLVLREIYKSPFYK